MDSCLLGCCCVAWSFFLKVSKVLLSFNVGEPLTKQHLSRPEVERCEKPQIWPRNRLCYTVNVNIKSSIL